MHVESGTKLGRYEILSEIGTGGMGLVYRAKDTTLDRTVAIKVLKPELVSNAQGFERFRREAKAIAGLSHPNIISLFDFGVENNIHFAVMELADGQPLEECIDKIDREDVPALARSIAQGLRAAHEGGIIHRDIKPSNIMLAPSGEPKILDFGLASVIDTRHFNDETLAPSDLKTQEGTIMGTVGYMSPEQVRGQKADERSDIFSF
ncbi:MAG: serine/threonine protein kinase [Pirellulales bacterium]|nr:serine/threonine protein kinase [Pirellulales bacterium]